MTQTHWKKLTNPNYIGAYSLEPGEERIITIKTVSKEMVKDTNGKEEQCVVAQLANEKPFILNKTNMKTISKVVGSPFIEDWAGKKVTIYAAKVKAFGDTVEALRVRDKKPELPDLNPKHPKWEDAKKAIKAGQVTIEQIRNNYQLSNENEKLLMS